MTAAFKEWLATRPAEIQELAKQFPLPSIIELNGEDLHLLGYCEAEHGAGLILSPIDPFKDYDGACAAKIHLCPECLPNIVRK